MGVNANTGKTEVFSFEHTPDVIISDAVRISMSIPVLYEPHALYAKNEEGLRVPYEPKLGQVYIDGGVLDNYPLWLFDKAGYLNPEGFVSE